TPEQLKADLAKGMTLHQIADAESPPVAEAQFRSRLIANLKPVLDAMVTNKQITSEQEQKILQQLQTGPIPFWDKPMHKPTAAAVRVRHGGLRHGLEAVGHVLHRSLLRDLQQDRLARRGDHRLGLRSHHLDALAAEALALQAAVTDLRSHMVKRSVDLRHVDG